MERGTAKRYEITLDCHVSERITRWLAGESYDNRPAGQSAIVSRPLDSAGGTMIGTNASLALQNATLAAESMRLGSFYAGFVVLAGERSDALNKLLNIPETHQIFGALALGHPQLKYRSWPERNPAKVTWL